MMVYTSQATNTAPVAINSVAFGLIPEPRAPALNRLTEVALHQIGLPHRRARSSTSKISRSAGTNRSACEEAITR